MLPETQTTLALTLLEVAQQSFGKVYGFSPRGTPEGTPGTSRGSPRASMGSPQGNRGKRGRTYRLLVIWLYPREFPVGSLMGSHRWAPIGPESMYCIGLSPRLGEKLPDPPVPAKSSYGLAVPCGARTSPIATTTVALAGFNCQGCRGYQTLPRPYNTLPYQTLWGDPPGDPRGKHWGVPLVYPHGSPPPPSPMKPRRLL